MKTYLVTVTPKMKVYSGGWSNGQYTEEVYAKDANEAIKKARRIYRDNGNDVAATFKANVKVEG
jgi:hypothetical protein